MQISLLLGFDPPSSVGTCIWKRKIQLQRPQIGEHQQRSSTDVRKFLKLAKNCQMPKTYLKSKMNFMNPKRNTRWRCILKGISKYLFIIRMIFGVLIRSWDPTNNIDFPSFKKKRWYFFDLLKVKSAWIEKHFFCWKLWKLN